MDCYDEILINYQRKDQEDPNKLEKWLNNFIIGLMTRYFTQRDSLTIQNCLILLINLFFEIEYPDHYHTKGKATPSLTESEFNHFYKLMKRELQFNTNFKG
ncbi:MAG: hypothetical protein GF353_19590 [Candidatus Lokiarchaeota archaeon]|nr:hypothetical protein [Candidatus Lokiarchaeota archaeon]